MLLSLLRLSNSPALQFSNSPTLKRVNSRKTCTPPLRDATQRSELRKREPLFSTTNRARNDMPTDLKNTTVDHPDLKELLEDVRRASEGVEELKHLSKRQLSWKPAPKSWNTLECIEHLRVTGEHYYHRVEDAIARSEAQNRRSDEAVQQGFVGRFFIKAVSPETERKVKTLQAFQPAEEATADVTILDRFLDQQSEIEALLRRADGLDLNGEKLTSPASRFIRFTIGEALTMLAKHQLRHLQQARRLQEHPGFPGS